MTDYPSSNSSPFLSFERILFWITSFFVTTLIYPQSSITPERLSTKNPREINLTILFLKKKNLFLIENGFKMNDDFFGEKKKIKVLIDGLKVLLLLESFSYLSHVLQYCMHIRETKISFQFFICHNIISADRWRIDYLIRDGKNTIRRQTWKVSVSAALEVIQYNPILSKTLWGAT